MKHFKHDWKRRIFNDRVDIVIEAAEQNRGRRWRRYFKRRPTVKETIEKTASLIAEDIIALTCTNPTWLSEIAHG